MKADLKDVIKTLQKLYGDILYERILDEVFEPQKYCEALEIAIEELKLL